VCRLFFLAQYETTLLAVIFRHFRLKLLMDTSSLSDLKKIGCKNCGAIHILPLSWAIERLLPGEIDNICPRSATFSLRFFKSDRLLEFFAS
jgi:hypothetical protein